MKPALLLIDLQNDYLSAPGLQPPAGAIVDRAASLLNQCRQARIPVIHIQTSVQRDPDNRMPHWKSAGRWICVAGTPGQSPPPALAPGEGETVLHKPFFSAFGNPDLERMLRALGCDTLILAGVHLHACIRTSALDGYQRGFAIRVADDAVGSDDPLHAAITRRYLLRRAVRFATVDRILQERDRAAADVVKAVNGATNAHASWRSLGVHERAAGILRLADQLEAQASDLARVITRDVGKPITMAIAEIHRSAALCRTTASLANQPLEIRSSGTARYRYEPLGVVAIITPWNNPIAIPLGKIAPALLYGNTVVWKASPWAALTAQWVMKLIQQVLPAGVVELCSGDASIAHALAEQAGIDGVTLSGSLAAGIALQEICTRRSIPFQGELGGNNASIVWDDTDLDRAADEIARGAFGFAGQRCTANRRAIVAESIFEPFIRTLQSATAILPLGDPLDPKTIIGPLISPSRAAEVAALLARARDAGCQIFTPHDTPPGPAYHPPAIVICENPQHEIVQEETFGPVLVVQRARDFDRAIELLNGVRQGLVAAIFSDSPARREQFLREARCGVLKIDRSTVDADAVSPLGGWKASGVGPAEHGPSDREFFCRVQTIYDG